MQIFFFLKKEKTDNSEVIISFKMLENSNSWPVC